MAAPRVTIPELPEQTAPVDANEIVVQDGATTKRMTVGRLTTQTNGAISAHVGSSSGAHTAAAISATTSGEPLTGTDVQSQLSQANSALSGMSDQVNGATTGLSDHLADTTAHTAAAIVLTPGGSLAATNVQAGLVELQGDIDTNTVNINADVLALSNHLSDPTAAHAASAVSMTPAGNLVATTVQAGLVELQTSIDATDASITGRLLPAGGTINQALTKTSATNYAVGWSPMSPVRRLVNLQTGTAHTPVPPDENLFFTMSNAGTITVTLPSNATSAIPVSAEIDFLWLGVGQVVFVAGGGATINSKNGWLKISVRYGVVTAKKISTDGWLLYGDLAA